MCIVLSCLDMEATQEACSYCIYKAAATLHRSSNVTCSSYLPAIHAFFGVFGYKYYPMVFLGSCFMPCKRHDDIVAIARYIQRLFGD